MPKSLSDDQINHYKEQGYVFPVPALSSEEAASARAKLEAHEQLRGEPIGAKERSKSFMLFTWVDEIMRNEQLVDAVEDLIGPNILCWNSIFWIKEANTPSFVGWHQDLTYWGLDNDELVTAWVALSPASEASGCMSVLPGSHLELLDHTETYNDDNLLSRGQELTINVSEHNPAAMPLESGQASFHNVKSAHGSGANSTNDRRIGLSFHYMPTHTRQLLSEHDTAALVRGTDTFNHFEHCPRPAADLHPDAVAAHRDASSVLREIIYKGAEQQTSPTL